MNQPLSYVLHHDASYPMQFALLSTQRGIFLADHLSEIEDLYAIAHCLELPNSIDLHQFKQAIQQGLSEAESVSATYSTQPDHAVLHVQPESQMVIEEFDFRHLPPKQAMQRVWDWMPTDREHAKSLKQDQQQLYRQVLFITHDTIYWYQRYHHIMLDGFSLINLSKRIIEIYQQIAAQQTPKPSPFIALQEVIQERLAYENSQQFKTDQQFWQHYCEDLPSPITLSIHHAAAKTTARFIKHQLRFSQGILKETQDLATQYKVALPDMMMALSLLYLYKMSDKAELVVGIPFMRRLGSKAIRSPLPTVNVLPVKFQLSPQEDWLSLALQVQQQLQRIRPHQKYDAEQILRDLNSIDIHERIYGPILNYKAFDQDLNLNDHQVKTHHISTGPIDDFEFSFIVQNQELIIELRADALRYTQNELFAHGQRLTLLLEQGLSSPRQAIQDINILPKSEAQALIKAGTGAKISHPEKYNNILDIFYEQAALYPDRIALISGEREQLYQLSFSELSLKINQLTRYLQAQGAQKNTVIAGAIPRSAESVVVMLSVLNSGASFLPLDLDYPIDRMQMMCEDANPLFALTTQSLTNQLPKNLKQIHLDDPNVIAAIQDQDSSTIPAIQRHFDFQDVAYVIFTSGSTGRPKGVMNTHGSLLNLILSHRDTIYQPALNAVNQQYPHRPLRAAHTHSFSFDSSWLQVFWMLWGQELHIFDENMRRDAWGLVQEIQHRHIDTLDLPPSFCAQMITNGLFATDQHHPRLILIGGEAAPLALWQQLNAQTHLFAHNLYGPTEYTVDTFRAELKQTDRPVIANPIGNTQAYVLDRNLQLCATGVIGELYISGFGIANGYLGRADLSSTRFVANPFDVGQRMYRTGDLVRWNNAGKLEFMGRCDDQIKIRGYRVEIGEVENALSILPNIESVVVIAEPINNSHRLLGYCVVKDLTWNEEQAEQLSQTYLSQLRQNLPDYMVPSALTVMQQFPRNVSGKVDKKALPRPQIRTQSRIAQTPEQQLLCDLCAQILKIENIGIDDDFFMTGGDSISAIMLCTHLRKQGYMLKPSDVFQLKNIAALSTCLQKLEQQPSIPQQLHSLIDANITQKIKAEYGNDYNVLPLLPLQKGMLFHAQLEQQQASYNAFTQISLHGEIDPLRLQQALNTVLRKHPQLSGWFDTQNTEEPIFIYTQQPTQNWPLTSLVCNTDQLEMQIQHALQHTMQLDQEYGALRTILIQHTAQHAELIIIVHHLLTDGWSTPLFIQDLIDAYQHPLTPLKSLTDSYHDVVMQLIQQDHTAARRIWAEDLQDAQPLILFEHAKKQAVEEYAYQLSPALSTQLEQRLRKAGITLNVFMQMIWAMTLQTYAYREEIVFGTPVSGRTAPIMGLEQQIGLFLNTIPVQVKLNMQQSLWQQLDHLQHSHVCHLEQDGIGLNEIQTLLGKGNLFDTLLVVENYPDHHYLKQQLGDAKIEKLTNRGYSHYPLALLVIPDQSIELLLEHRGVITQPEQLMARMVQFIETALDQPDRVLAEYPLQLPKEVQHLKAINQTQHAVPATTLQQLLNKAAKQHPQALALVDEQHQLSLQQVREQVYGLAQQIQQHGVQAGDVIAIALPRSVKLSLAILAVIEAGAAYLPIDLQHPNERIQYMLQDAQPRLIITEASLLPDAQILRFNFDALLTPDVLALVDYQTTLVSPQHPAYMIYTSGTMGQPKGVLVSHQAIVNRILWMQDQYPLNTTDVILQKTPSTFDVSVWEFFWSYLVGARLVMAPEHAHKDPLKLLDIIQKQGITTLHFVPSMLSVFENAVSTLMSAEQRRSLPLKRVFCSGEALPIALATNFFQHFSCALYNLYGPTEAAVDVSYMNARAPSATQENSVPIGYPVWNTELYILDQYLRPVPVGVHGELYIAGEQLALGYHNRPDLTANRFVANPFQVGKRMYRTGDIAHWQENGSIQYVGRADDQLKIRGQRVELGEIEQQIRLITQIDDVVVHPVALNASQEPQLIAYVKTNTSLDTASLKKKLAKALPAYMCPSHFMSLAEFPLSHNGKLDRKALPKPTQLDTQIKRLPNSETEHKVAIIFKQLLNIQEDISVDADFFALGGHSILVMKLVIELRKIFNQSLPMGMLMTQVSIERIAALLLSQERLQHVEQNGMQPILHIRSGTTHPLFCFSPGSGSAWQYTALSPYLDPNIPIIGLQSPRPEGLLANSASMDELAEKQLELIRSIQPQGPYSFLGHSLGGTVAYAVAAKLREQNECVDYLGLLDTYPAEIHQWLDPSVEEMNAEAEQEQFFNDILEEADISLYQETQRLQQDIFANYRDAVRLLKPYKMPKFDGHLHVVVAEKDLLPYIQPQAQWEPLVAQLSITTMSDANHSNILSPKQLQKLGLILNTHIEHARQLKGADHVL